MANSIIFNALNGAELTKVLVDKLKFALDQSGEFPAHRTFPWVKVKLTIALTCHPQMDMKEEPVEVITPIEVEAGERYKLLLPKEGAPNPLPMQFDKGKLNMENLVEVQPVTIDMVLTQVLDTPDKARMESDLPLPIQTEIRAGTDSMTVDKPTIPQAAPAKVDQIRPQSAPRVNIPAPSPLRVPVPVPGAKKTVVGPPPPPPVKPTVLSPIQPTTVVVEAPPNPTPAPPAETISEAQAH